MITNISTTTATVGNTQISGLGYTWSQVVTTWADSDFTWNNVEQQSAPAGVVITNQTIS